MATRAARAAPLWGAGAGRSPGSRRSRRLVSWRGASATDPARPGPVLRGPRHGSWAPAPLRGAPSAVHPLLRFGPQLSPPLPAAVAKFGG